MLKIVKNWCGSKEGFQNGELSRSRNGFLKWRFWGQQEAMLSDNIENQILLPGMLDQFKDRLDLELSVSDIAYTPQKKQSKLLVVVGLCS